MSYKVIIQPSKLSTDNVKFNIYRSKELILNCEIDSLKDILSMNIDELNTLLTFIVNELVKNIK